MSITFRPQPEPEPTQWELNCWDTMKTLDTVSSREEADRRSVEHSRTCGDCSFYRGMYIAAVETWPTLNMSMVNADRILRTLGLVTAVAALSVAEVRSYGALSGFCMIESTEIDGSAEGGFVPHFAGSVTAEDFLGRVLTAQALSPVDAGQVTYSPAPGHHVSARQAGYLQDRLANLAELAQYCRDNQMAVTWS